MEKKKETIFSATPTMEYFEEAPRIDPGEFQKVIDSRRAVRIYDGSPIPDEIVMKCMSNALLAPNSSNLQPWEFYRVTTPDIKAALIRACLSQIAVKTAAEIIVVVARTGTWKGHAREMLRLFKGVGSVSSAVLDYYGRLVPFVYSQGLFSAWGLIKRIIYFFRGLRKPTIREPVSRAQVKTWAVKSTALAAENIMLSFRAYGYDSCPMEGFDPRRIKRLLGLARDAVVVMVISAGKRAKGGIYGPRIRFDQSRYIKVV